ncbi:MAG: hypothetical protein NVS2B16_11340 [Chloroflexota bacterium]
MQAVVVTAVALLLWLMIGRTLGATPYLFFLPAVIAASWRNGVRSGALVTVLGSMASVYFFMPSTHGFGIPGLREALLLGLFVVVALGISWLNEGRMKNERDRQASEAQTKRILDSMLDTEMRLKFLAEADALLASSLDYETTLTSVARLAVPQIGDWCGVHIVDEDGEVRQLAATHVDPAKVALAHDLEHRLPYDPHAVSGVPQVLRTGTPELTPEITDEMLAATISDDELLAIFRALGLRSSMIVPMVARGHTVGAITLIAAESGRRYSTADLALAENLAARAALAVDNARLYREAQRVGSERAAILSQMADGVAIVDTSGRIVFTNDAARRMLGGPTPGLTLASAIGQLHIATVSGQPYPMQELPLSRALSKGETIVDAEWRMQRHDGVQIITQGSAAPLLSEDGTLLGAVSTFRDVTAQRAVERQKDDFLSAAAHDLKTPLTSIKGLAQILQRRAAQISDREVIPLVEGLRQIDVAATRMTRLINELLDISRVEMDRPLPLNEQLTDLVSLTKQVVGEFQQGIGSHRITVETVDAELLGHWDSERLERVIMNLLSNAVKYSPNGGDILVTVSVDCPQERSIATITVTDHGMGIPTPDMPRIFDRFYRARNVDGRIPGTGIGLAGAKQIVELHGGTIEIDSHENDGTTVTVRLPMQTQAEPVSQVASRGA